MTPRILSQSGNVIAADFGKPASLNITINTQILYCDAVVCLARITYLHDGKPAGIQHILAEVPQH